MNADPRAKVNPPECAYRNVILKTIPQFARERGWQRRTALRRLLALREKELEAGGAAGWMVRVGRRWLINEELLEAALPGMFKPRDLEARVAELEAQVEELGAALATIGPIVRELRRRIGRA